MPPVPPTVLVLNGPSLNLLGTREPEVYGTDTLADVEQRCREAAQGLGLEVEFAQHNGEGELIDAVHAARTRCAAIVLNPAGYSHTSIALMDALAAVALPVVEVHISNVHRREEFRHHSYLSAVSDAVIVGAGVDGYRLAVDHLVRKLTAA